MNLTTSRKISLKFTLFTIAIIFFLGTAINGIFLGFWWRAESIKLMQWIPLHNTLSQQRGSILGISGAGNNADEFVPRKMRNMLPRGAMPKNEVKKVSSNDTFAQDLHESAFIGKLAHVEDERYLFSDEGTQTSYTSVQGHIDLQQVLFWTTVRLSILFGIASYILSLFFVKHSLKGLQDLVDFITDLHFDDLHKRVPLTGPEQDEIRIVAHAINEFLDKLQHQSQALKDFVAHASHELKTPLMTISSTVDYMRKAKEYDTGFNTIKDTLHEMHILIANLLLLAKAESQENFEKQPKKLVPIINRISQELAQQYANKNISCTLSLDESTKKEIHEPAFELMVKNLIDNAYKYTPQGGYITIYLDKTHLQINDSGMGIESKHLTKIWDKFWKVDASRQDTKSFGLGLSLVKMLVDRHGWTISVESKHNQGTSFTLVFDHAPIAHRR